MVSGVMNRKRQLQLALALWLFTNPAVADNRADLIAVIEAAGHNETDAERHRVEISGCTMTTYFWRNLSDQGWVLWTSFLIPMPDVMLIEDKKVPGNFFHSFRIADKPHTAIILFQAREGVEVRHEKPVQRKSKRETTPSPRGDGTTHFYEYKDEFLIFQKGPDVIDKARAFSEGFLRYVQEYCTFIG